LSVRAISLPIVQKDVQFAYLFTFWRNRIDLIDEDDGGRVLFSLFKRLSQVTLRFSRHFAHDFRAIDQEEKCTGLVSHRTGNKGFTGTRRTIHKDTTGGFYTNRLEELRMPEWQFNQFSNLGHLLATATDIVVTNVGQVALLVFALNWVTLGVDDSVGGDDAVFGGIGF
jgi:hypothetical protein